MQHVGHRASDEIARLREALRKVREQVDDLSWTVNRNVDHIFAVIDAALKE